MAAKFSLEGARMADFFISYTQSDIDKAKWIAAQLEAIGYTTIAQFKDMPPGSNFVIEMDEAAKQARQTIAVLSSEYLASDYCQQELAAALRVDPKGKERKLIPVRVRQCKPEGLLGSIVYIDLVDKDDERAKELLISGVKGQTPARTEPPINQLLQERLNQIKKKCGSSVGSDQARSSRCSTGWMKSADGSISIKDVDAVFQPTSQIREAAERVARTFGLPSDWLNDAVKGFVAHSQRAILDLSALKVYAPGPDYPLAMKTLASRVESADKVDILFLIKLLGLKTANEVFAILEQYYPRQQIKPATQFFVEELFEELEQQQ